MKNCVEEMFYKLERWLKDPTFATYGNKRNTFSSWFDPVIYDYIFHRSNADDVEVWTNWFEMPLLKFLFEKKVETIFAGVDNYGGQETPTGVGPLCELVSDGADKASESETFWDYYETLRLACVPGRAAEYGWVNWTVAHDTPDLVYYQSYEEFGLGWKIHVVNEGQAFSSSIRVESSSSQLVLVLLMMASLKVK